MKKYYLFLALSLGMLSSHAQSIKKIPVSNSGCSVYTFCDFKFESAYSEDSSLMYVSECAKDETIYGVICVKLKQPGDNLDHTEASMTSYLDYLKTKFNITNAAGYGKGHRLNNNENTRGVIDYWKDSDKNNWKVKAWTNGRFIAVLYGYSAKELNETKLNIFLDGFRFPGM